MAQTKSANNSRNQNRKRTTNSSNTRTRSSNGNSRSSNRTNSTRRTPVTSAENGDPSFADYWHAFSKTRAFKPVITISIVVLLVLLDLLFAWNNYDRFFTILGIELIIVSIIWVARLIFNISNDRSSTTSDNND